MKKFTSLCVVLVMSLSLGAALHLRSRSIAPDEASSRAFTHSAYVLKPIPASAVHHRQSGGPNIRIAESTSANWSGYAVPAPASSTFKDVKGSWTVPSVTATKGGPAYSSIWVGLDGYANGTVEQIGTEQDWTGKTANYYAWFEMYPDYAYQIVGFPVNPGDKITAQVSFTGTDSSGNKVFTLTINNETTPTTFTVPASYTTSSAALLQSAEWIVEAPSSLRGVLPLANFGTAELSDCSAGFHDIGYFDGRGLDPLTMAAGKGRKSVVKAVPSPLNTANDGFTVTWQHQ